MSLDLNFLAGLALSVALAMVMKSIKKVQGDLKSAYTYSPMIRNARTTNSTISKVLILSTHIIDNMKLFYHN